MELNLDHNYVVPPGDKHGISTTIRSKLLFSNQGNEASSLTLAHPKADQGVRPDLESTEIRELLEKAESLTSPAPPIGDMDVTF